ncbi:MAG: prepilin-type N-terminal cleavage/methylation domain-containing protein [Sedimentisphaerales bacterium]|nr:prepilin-type N-terminal cleavage/methylation domain-containing protein [Sedimentisphaerales bacterium]
MNFNRRTKKAFTLVELMVAIGILVIVLSFAGVIFRVGINSHRTAAANAEIMQKLRAITSQLNSDFKGLNKDGEIFVVWEAKPLRSTVYKDNDLDGYERFDRIMFFAEGDFQSYGIDPMVRGNTARICYMLARQNNSRPEEQNCTKRILARTQHILTDDENLADFPNTGGFTDVQWIEWNNRYEYDKISLEQWKRIPWVNKKDILSVVTDVRVSDSIVSEDARGAIIEPSDANSVHMLFCEGVSEFKIQGWSEQRQKWLPEVDPDRDGSVTDTHFFMYSSDPNTVPGVLYPYPPNGLVLINNINYPREQVDKIHFNEIPGLGKALKFTFTLFDSKGIIKEGRTFTHIIYLDG